MCLLGGESADSHISVNVQFVLTEDDLTHTHTHLSTTQMMMKVILRKGEFTFSSAANMIWTFNTWKSPE